MIGWLLGGDWVVVGWWLHGDGWWLGGDWVVIGW